MKRCYQFSLINLLLVCSFVLVSFADKFAVEFGIPSVSPGIAILFAYGGLIGGDLVSAVCCQVLKSRRKTLFIFFGILCLTLILFFFLTGGGSLISMYAFYLLLGLGIGFSVVNITMSAEQFGIILRATAAISIPNMILGSLTITLWLFKLMRDFSADYIYGAAMTAAILVLAGLNAAILNNESFGNDLDYHEY